MRVSPRLLYLIRLIVMHLSLTFLVLAVANGWKRTKITWDIYEPGPAASNSGLGIVLMARWRSFSRSASPSCPGALCHPGRLCVKRLDNLA